MFAFGSELAPYFGDEVEWYADDAKNVVGVIAEGISGSSWNYTTLRRNVLGDFLVSTLGRNSFKDLQTARFACLLEMTAPYDGQNRVASQRD